MKFYKNITELTNTRKDRKNKVVNTGDLSSVRAKSEEIINNSFAGRKLFEVGNIPSAENPRFINQHIGGFMYDDKGVMTIGICVEEDIKPPYAENGEIGIGYADGEEFSLVSAKVWSIREADENDLGILNALFKQNMNSILSVFGKAKFVVADISFLAEPKKQQRRQYERIKVSWPVHFQILDSCGELESAQKKWVDEKKISFRGGYFNTKTADISAGGFKSVIKIQIPKGTEIKCVIEIQNGRLKAIGEINGKIIGCDPSRDKQEFFDMRVQFMSKLLG